MWKKITGRASDVDSRPSVGSSRRKDESSSRRRTSEAGDGSKRRRRTEDTRVDDDDDNDVQSSTTRRSTGSHRRHREPEEDESLASSYATARESKSRRSEADEDGNGYAYEKSRKSENGDRERRRKERRDAGEKESSRRERREDVEVRRSMAGDRESSRRERRDDRESSRAIETENLVSQDKRGDDQSSRRERRDTVGTTRRSEGDDGKEGRRERSDKRKDSTISRKEDRVSSRAITSSSRAIDGPTGSRAEPDAHIDHQFPGQVPNEFTGPYRPPLAATEGGPGLASEYYGDQGESVSQQPGVRPEILINSQPHLMAALAEAKPPEETGQGTAADYFNTAIDFVGPATVGGAGAPSGSSRPPRPNQPSNSQSSGLGALGSAAALAAGGAALGYGLGHQSSQSLSSTHAYNGSEVGASFTQDTSHLSAFQNVEPSSIVSSPRVSPSTTPPRPYRPIKPTSHLPEYALGAAGVAAAAAGAYAIHEHNVHAQQHSSQQNGSYPPRLTSRPTPNGTSSAAMALHQHEHRGPLNKFVDWWKDYEDVRKMEMYTEAIGVCKYCFDPNSSPMDAPRKHHYNRKRTRSSESLRKSGEFRVDKESRYAESDRKRNTGLELAAGAVGAYGLAKAAQSLKRRESQESRLGSKSRSEVRHKRSRSFDRESRTSRGVVENDRTEYVTEEKIVDKDGKVRVERRVRRRSRDRESERERKGTSALLGAAAFATGAAGVAALNSREKRHNRSPSRRSERDEYRRESSSHRSRRSPERLTIRRRESNKSQESLRSSAQAVAGAGILGGILASGPEKRRRSGSRQRKRRTFFGFSNASSSGSENGLNYGLDYREVRRRSRERRRKSRKEDSKSKKDSHIGLEATLVGLGATAAAITAAQHGRNGLGKRPSRSELFAVRQQKDRTRGAVLSSKVEEDEGWESASDDGKSAHGSFESGLAYGYYDRKGKGRKSTESLASSNLAYGDYDLRIKNRKSTDSLTSDASGGGLWGWRWGRKSKKPKRESEENFSEQTGLGDKIAPAAVAAIAGAAAAGAAASVINSRKEELSSVSSGPSMQSVYPVGTADPSSFGVSRRYESSNKPVYTSHPENQLPIEAPQPIVPVSSALYNQTQSYVAPTGPPVDFSKPRRSRTESERFQGDEERRSDIGRKSNLKRRNTSPTQSHMGRDFAIAGVAAAAAAGAVAASRHSRRASSPSPSVRFDLSHEEGQKKDPVDIRERPRREEADAVRRQHELREKKAAFLNDQAEQWAEEARAAHREAERLQENDRRKGRLQEQAENWAAEARAAHREAERMHQMDKEAQKLEFARREAETQAYRTADEEIQKGNKSTEAIGAAVGVATAGAVITTMAKRHEDDRAERESDSHEAPIKSTHIEEREPESVHPESEDTDDENPRHFHELKPRYVEIVPTVASNVEVDDFDDDFEHDPDHFIKKRQRKVEERKMNLWKQVAVADRAADAVEEANHQSPDDVYEDLAQRYKDSTVNAGSFFAPEELSTSSKEVTPTSPNADVDIALISGGLGRPPYEKEYTFTSSQSGYSAPWPIPSLQLIPATPPISRGGSPLPEPRTEREPEPVEKKEAVKDVEVRDEKVKKDVHAGETNRDASTASYDKSDDLVMTGAGAGLAGAVVAAMQSRKKQSRDDSGPKTEVKDASSVKDVREDDVREDEKIEKVQPYEVEEAEDVKDRSKEARDREEHRHVEEYSEREEYRRAESPEPKEADENRHVEERKEEVAPEDSEDEGGRRTYEEDRHHHHNREDFPDEIEGERRHHRHQSYRDVEEQDREEPERHHHHHRPYEDDEDQDRDESERHHHHRRHSYEDVEDQDRDKESFGVNEESRHHQRREAHHHHRDGTETSEVARDSIDRADDRSSASRSSHHRLEELAAGAVGGAAIAEAANIYRHHEETEQESREEKERESKKHRLVEDREDRKPMSNIEQLEHAVPVEQETRDNEESVRTPTELSREIPVPEIEKVPDEVPEEPFEESLKKKKKKSKKNRRLAEIEDDDSVSATRESETSATEVRLLEDQDVERQHPESERELKDEPKPEVESETVIYAGELEQEDKHRLDRDIEAEPEFKLDEKERVIVPDEETSIEPFFEFAPSGKKKKKGKKGRKAFDYLAEDEATRENSPVPDSRDVKAMDDAQDPDIIPKSEKELEEEITQDRNVIPPIEDEIAPKETAFEPALTGKKKKREKTRKDFDYLADEEAVRDSSSSWPESRDLDAREEAREAPANDAIPKDTSFEPVSSLKKKKGKKGRKTLDWEDDAAPDSSASVPIEESAPLEDAPAIEELSSGRKKKKKGQTALNWGDEATRDSSASVPVDEEQALVEEAPGFNEVSIEKKKKKKAKKGKQFHEEAETRDIEKEPVQLEPATEPEVTAEQMVEQEPGTEAVVEPEVEPKPEITTEQKGEQEPGIETVVEPEAGSKPETAAEREVDQKPETEAVDEPDAESKPEITAEREVDQKPETEAVDEPDAESKSEITVEPEVDQQPEIQAVAEPEPEFETLSSKKKKKSKRSKTIEEEDVPVDQESRDIYMKDAKFEEEPQVQSEHEAKLEPVPLPVDKDPEQETFSSKKKNKRSETFDEDNAEAEEVSREVDRREPEIEAGTKLLPETERELEPEAHVDEDFDIGSFSSKKKKKKNKPSKILDEANIEDEPKDPDFEQKELEPEPESQPFAAEELEIETFPFKKKEKKNQRSRALDEEDLDESATENQDLLQDATEERPIVEEHVFEDYSSVSRKKKKKSKKFKVFDDDEPLEDVQSRDLEPGDPEPESLTEGPADEEPKVKKPTVEEPVSLEALEKPSIDEQIPKESHPEQEMEQPYVQGHVVDQADKAVHDTEPLSKEVDSEPRVEEAFDKKAAEEFTHQSIPGAFADEPASEDLISRDITDEPLEPADKIPTEGPTEERVLNEPFDEPAFETIPGGKKKNKSKKSKVLEEETQEDRDFNDSQPGPVPEEPELEIYSVKKKKKKNKKTKGLDSDFAQQEERDVELNEPEIPLPVLEEATIEEFPESKKSKKKRKNKAFEEEHQSEDRDINFDEPIEPEPADEPILEISSSKKKKKGKKSKALEEDWAEQEPSKDLEMPLPVEELSFELSSGKKKKGKKPKGIEEEMSTERNLDLDQNENETPLPIVEEKPFEDYTLSKKKKKKSRKSTLVEDDVYDSSSQPVYSTDAPLLTEEPTFADFALGKRKKKKGKKSRFVDEESYDSSSQPVSSAEAPLPIIRSEPDVELGRIPDNEIEVKARYDDENREPHVHAKEVAESVLPEDEMETNQRNEHEVSIRDVHDKEHELRSPPLHPEHIPLPEDDTEIHTLREDHEHHEAKSIAPEVDFAATLAAGLKDSGFNEDMVINDPVFSRPSSRAGGLEKPDFDDFPQHASRKTSRRSSRRGSRAQSLDRGFEAEREMPQESTTIDDKEFNDIVTAGLHGAGFSRDAVDEKHESEHQDADLTEITGMRNSKSAWNTLGKRSDEDVKAAASEDEPVSREVKADPEEEWSIPVQKTRSKKKRKGSKMQTDSVEDSASTEVESTHESNHLTMAAGAAMLGAGIAAVAAHEHNQNNEVERELHDDPTEGVKRSVPAAFDSSVEPPRKLLKEESVENVAQAQGHDQISARDLAQSSWSFAGNRDSAIEMEESSVLPTPHLHQSIRDSGFQEAPDSPVDKSRRRSQGSPKSPMKVQVEVPANWEVKVAQGSPQKEVPGEVMEVESHHQLQSSSPTVESTSKDRSNALLFHSSPSTREQASTRDLQTEEIGDKRYKSIFGSPTPERRPSPKQLEDIMEIDPDSPLAKKTQGETRKVSETQGLGISSSPARAISPSSMVSVDELLASRSWPAVDEENETVGINAVVTGSRKVSPPIESRRSSARHQLHRRSSKGDLRSPSSSSERLVGSFERVKSPDVERPSSVRSNHSLRRIHSSRSGDLRTLSRSGSKVFPSQRMDPIDGALVAGAALAGSAVIAGPSTARDKGKARVLDMEGIYEGVGDLPESPRSPTRPQSLRKRQSLHIMDLESSVSQLRSDNRSLQEARAKAEQTVRDAEAERDAHATRVRHATQAVADRDVQIQEHQDQIRELRDEIGSLQNQVDRLAQENARLTEQNQGLATTHTSLQEAHDHTHKQWQETLVALAALQAQHKHMSDGMDQMVREQVSTATSSQEQEIARLQQELDESRQQIRSLQQQILSSKQDESFLNMRDEDYFDTACQNLCEHIQLWVKRFSKFSDNAKCRLTSKLKDQSLEDRLDDTILDGSDVDDYLQDRIMRRNVFMSLVMSMIFEYVFTRYLFGLDQDQRGKLKKLEKTLTEVGPQEAVAQWRAITLTLLSKRPAFQDQAARDTEAVAHEIFDSLCKLLPPPSHLRQSSLDSLRKVLKVAVDLSVEMRTQRPEYVMLPPLRPEYDTDGNLVQRVFFNASLMNERSPQMDERVGESPSNEELEEKQAIVQMVLFPLVIKKGDDRGVGEDEIVICPAQVLVQRPSGKKVVRVVSGAMDAGPRESAVSFAE